MWDSCHFLLLFKKKLDNDNSPGYSVMKTIAHIKERVDYLHWWWFTLLWLYNARATWNSKDSDECQVKQGFNPWNTTNWLQCQVSLTSPLAKKKRADGIDLQCYLCESEQNNKMIITTLMRPYRRGNRSPEFCCLSFHGWSRTFQNSTVLCMNLCIPDPQNLFSDLCRVTRGM